MVTLHILLVCGCTCTASSASRRSRDLVDSSSSISLISWLRFPNSFEIFIASSHGCIVASFCLKLSQVSLPHRSSHKLLRTPCGSCSGSSKASGFSVADVRVLAFTSVLPPSPAVLERQPCSQHLHLPLVLGGHCKVHLAKLHVHPNHSSSLSANPLWCCGPGAQHT